MTGARRYAIFVLVVGLIASAIFIVMLAPWLNGIPSPWGEVLTVALGLAAGFGGAWLMVLTLKRADADTTAKAAAERRSRARGYLPPGTG